jgi:hypothetical protein
MAGTTVYSSPSSSTGFSSGFTTGVISRIEAEAYKMLYDEGLLPKLCKRIGQGQKGSAIVYPYFDPSAVIASTSGALVETTDATTFVGMTNASVIVIASEFGIPSLVTDVVKESAIVDVPGELARQQGLGVAVKVETHILAKIAAGVTTGTITGTNSTDGFTIAKYAAVKSRLDSAALTVPGRKSCVVPGYSWYYTAKGTWSAGSATYGGPSVMGNLGDQIVSKYYVATLFGDMDVYTHSLAYVAASSAAAGFAFVKDAVALWVPREYRLEKQRDASARGDEIISTMRAGAKVLHAGYVKRLKMYAAAPS